jgi:hypothetical protein
MSGLALDIASVLFLGLAFVFIGVRLYRIGQLLDELEAARVRERVLGYNINTKEDS